MLTTNEAGVLENFFFLLLLAPQIGKCVDDDTKDQIEDDDDDDEEEQKVVNDSSEEQRFLTTEQTNDISINRDHIDKVMYVVHKPPRGGSKPQNGRFPWKIVLRLNKVCYKVSSYENCQRQSCNTFIGAIIHPTMTGGGRPLERKFCIK